MKCPFCSQLDSKVIDSRTSTAGDVIRRRRECEGCARRFTSRERVEDVLPTVVKKGGAREPFDRDKLLAGIVSLATSARSPWIASTRSSTTSSGSSSRARQRK